MTKIRELFDQRSSIAAQFNSLGQVCEIANEKRKSINKSFRIEGNIPYYGAKGKIDKVQDFNYDGNYVLVARVGTDSLENYSIHYTKGKFWANENVHVIRGKKNLLETKFLYYYLKKIDYRPYLTGLVNVMLTKTNLLKIRIPIPQIEIQEEIVNLLDQLTLINDNLQEELKSEVEYRRQQFDYYLNTLFSFDESYSKKHKKSGIINWYSLEELGMDVQTNILPRKNKSSNLVSIRITKKEIGESNNSKPRESDKDSCEKVVRLNNEQVVVSCHSAFQQNSINPKYIGYYFISNEFEKQKRSLETGISRPYLRGESICKLKIPIPNLEIQGRIVGILEKLDELAKDDSCGLLAEILFRTKEYEYYRNQLLNL